MYLQNKVLLSLCMLALLGLAGCARYQARPLARIAPQAQMLSPEHSVSFSHRVFSKRDCKRYLDRDVIAKGYQPVHISLRNNTDHALAFSLASVSVPCAYAEEVAQQVYTSTVNRAVGYGVASIFFWPLLIPAVVDSVGSSQANEKLDRDFMRKALHDQTIAPFSTINGLIFVPTESFTPFFSITLTDTTNNKPVVLNTNPSF